MIHSDKYSNHDLFFIHVQFLIDDTIRIYFFSIFILFSFLISRKIEERRNKCASKQNASFSLFYFRKFLWYVDTLENNWIHVRMYLHTYSESANANWIGNKFEKPELAALANFHCHTLNGYMISHIYLSTYKADATSDSVISKIEIRKPTSKIYVIRA